MADHHGWYRTVLVFGEPGSGKGTQGRILGNIPGFYHLACGDVFRSLDPASRLGKTFLEYSSRGKLAPDHFTVQVWREHIHRMVQSCHFNPEDQILVLDGIPRNAHQAEMMKDYIDVILLIYLEMADEEALVTRIRRRALRQNRLDDADERVIRARFREYQAETAPLLNYYPSERLRRVDAGGSPIEVLHQVVGVVREAVSSRG